MDKLVVTENEKVETPAQPTTPPTPEQQRAKVVAFIGQQWNHIGDEARRAIAKARGLLNPSITLTSDELQNLIPLEGDTMRYAKDKETGLPRIAASRLGLMCFPKQRGRKNRHLTKSEMAIKSASLQIFRRLFAECAAHMEAKIKEKGEPFYGIPEDMLNQLGARAARLGAIQVGMNNRVARRHVRRQQALSRNINRGLLNGNIEPRNYVYSGGQYGPR